MTPPFESDARYHLAELEIARDPNAAGHSLPPIPPGARAVLDVGCGAGQSLIAAGLRPEALACGVDPDVSALELGRTLTRDVRFTAAVAEALPFADATFDFVCSRVALPYADIPRSLGEMARVLKPRGAIWLILHPAGLVLESLAGALRALNPRAVLFNGYVLANGLLLHAFGRQVRWPLGRRRRFESFQTSRGMTRALAAAGFTDIRVDKARFFVVQATRADADERGRAG